MLEGTEQFRNIRKFIVHKNWNNETLDNDIALLVLDEPLEFVNYTSPITLRGPDWELPGKAFSINFDSFA